MQIGIYEQGLLAGAGLMFMGNVIGYIIYKSFLEKKNESNKSRRGHRK